MAKLRQPWVWISSSNPHTLDINSPKAPPRANPMPPDITVLNGQLSIAPCIYHSKAGQLSSKPVVSFRRALAYSFDHRSFLVAHAGCLGPSSSARHAWEIHSRWTVRKECLFGGSWRIFKSSEYFTDAYRARSWGLAHILDEPLHWQTADCCTGRRL